jgi:calcium channel MID1
MALDPLHRVLDDPLHLGDTTLNQAILFSPPLANSSKSPSSYPNYTLPAANLSLESPPGPLVASNFSLAIFPTSSSPAGRIPRTGCALRAATNGTGSILNEMLWQRGDQMWRHEWMIGALTPLTNYTAYGIINGTQISGPTYFMTKSGQWTII